MKTVLLKLKHEKQERMTIFNHDAVEIVTDFIIHALKILDGNRCVFFCPIDSVEFCQICDDASIIHGPLGGGEPTTKSKPESDPVFIKLPYILDKYSINRIRGWYGLGPIDGLKKMGG